MMRLLGSLFISLISSPDPPHICFVLPLQTRTPRNPSYSSWLDILLHPAPCPPFGLQCSCFQRHKPSPSSKNQIWSSPSFILWLATIRHISVLVSGPGQEFVTKESLLLRNLLQSASNLILHLSDTMSTTGNEYMTLNIVIVWLNTRRFSAYFHHSLNWR